MKKHVRLFSVSGYHRSTQIVDICAGPVSETSNDGQKSKINEIVSGSNASSLKPWSVASIVAVQGNVPNGLSGPKRKGSQN